MSKIIHLQVKKAFNDAVKSGPLLVDFWAPWCGPCKAFAPTLEGLAKKYDGKLTVGKVNLEEGDGADLANKYDVKSIPTLLLFVEGKLVNGLVGAVSAAKVEAFLKRSKIA